MNVDTHEFDAADWADAQADIGAELATGDACQVCVWCAEYGEVIPHSHEDVPAANRADLLDIFDTPSTTTGEPTS